MSPQYHFVFDNLFEAMFSSGNDILFDDICTHLIDSAYEFYFCDDKFNLNDPLVYHLPPPDEVWLSESKHHAVALSLA